MISEKARFEVRASAFEEVRWKLSMLMYLAAQRDDLSVRPTVYCVCLRLQSLSNLGGC